jgi:hypothetical protein
MPSREQEQVAQSHKVALKAEEREVALAEVQAVLAHAGDDGYREEVAALVAAVDEGVLDEPEAASLERVLELALHTGRIRALYGPGGEQAALRVYRRLPGGSAAAASAEQVSEALSALAGGPLEAVSIRAAGPGVYTVSLRAGGAELAVRLDRHGARLTSMGV